MAKVSNKALIAKKIGMTRVVDSEGNMIPVTLLKVENQRVTKLLSKEKDGYSGFQVGYFVKAEKNLTKADITRLRKTQIEDNFAKFTEFRTVEDSGDLQLGSCLSAEMFKEEKIVHVTGISKGKGTQGSVKRWGSAIGRMTHGSRFHRRPGSLGSNTTPGRVFKNKHQPGHMGVDLVTVKNLVVVDVDVEKNLIAIKGSVPGPRKSFVEIRSNH